MKWLRPVRYKAVIRRDWDSRLMEEKWNICLKIFCEIY